MSLDIVCVCGWKTTTNDQSCGVPASCPLCGGSLLVQGANHLDDVVNARLIESEPVAPRNDQPAEEDLGPAVGEYAVVETTEAPIRAAIPSGPRRVVLRKRPKTSRFAGLQIPVRVDTWGSIALALAGVVVTAVASAKGSLPIYGIVMVLFAFFRIMRIVLGRKD